MKMIVLVALCALNFALTAANLSDQTQIEKYADGRYKKYNLEVPGKEPITIIETAPRDDAQNEWVDISVNLGRGKDDVEIKNTMTDIIHDHDGNSDQPRCFGPSCQEGFIEEQGPHGSLEEFIADYPTKQKDYRDFSSDRLQAITALAEKLKKEKFKADRYYGSQSPNNMDQEEYQEDEVDNNGKVYTSWNRLKVKQHKHPYDDKDGWVTLEPVAWSTSKISKWKPNIKKHKPTWTDNEDRFPDEDKYSVYQGMSSTQSQNYPSKRPSMTRPVYINNKLHVTSSSSNWDSELPSKPTWNKPDGYYSYPQTWNPDDGRKPHKPHCDNEDNHQHGGQHDDDAIYYGMSDSVVTDNRPSYFPYEYEALKRPIRRPTQVVYAGTPDFDSERASKPPFGDGQWVLLSTTKGYRNKKRQRSLSNNEDRLNEDIMNPPTMTSHQAIGLTVLPVDDDHTNMTTSHGGLLEVERSFQTVEESKRDMDRKNDLRPDEKPATSNHRPSFNRVIRRKVISSVAPDSTSVLAAVGAGMVPATMAMVVPMMLGKRRRRDLRRILEQESLDPMIHKYE